MKQKRGQHTQRYRPALWSAGVGLLLLVAVDARAQAVIDYSVIASGGASGESGGIGFYATIGEPITSDSLGVSDETTWDGFWQVIPITPILSVDEERAGNAAGATALLGAQPSPFAAMTIIALQIARPGNVQLSVYDMLGREVERLIEGTREAGTLRITWRPDGLAPGNYFIRLEVDGVTYPTLPIQYYR